MPHWKYNPKRFAYEILLNRLLNEILPHRLNYYQLHKKILTEYIEFYFVLRKISKAKYEKRQEFRRHVTMTARLDSGKSVELTIDIITDYFDRVKELLDYVARMINYGAE